MSAFGSPDRRHRLVLVLHVMVLLAGLWFAWSQWVGVAVDQGAARQARSTLEELDRRLGQPGPGRASAAGPAQDPLLQGQTAALAGADLQDCVVSAIRAAGGTVTSSQIESRPRDSDAAGAAASLLALTVTFDLANDPLQAMLYGLENGMPALFLDHLSIETPEGSGGALRVSMTVSGFWRAEGRT